jgi:hypothetical protein
MRAGLGMDGDVIAAGFCKRLEIGSQGAIIRCASKIFLVCGRIALMTSGRRKCWARNVPSITSRWIQSAPAASTARTSSPSLAKSAARIDGAMTRGRDANC